MTRHKSRILVSGKTIAMALLMVSWAAAAHSATLYRYVNEKGFQEIGYSIPSHLVPNGYDVIDETGRLIKRVAPQLTEEEYAAKLEEERKLEACEYALDRVNRLYESLEDIDKAERLFQKKVAEDLRNNKANLEYLKTTLLENQDLAAQFERQGTPLTDQLLDKIENTEIQIQTIVKQISDAEGSKVSRAREFDEERRMFQLGECNPDRLAQAQHGTADG